MNNEVEIEELDKNLREARRIGGCQICVTVFHVSLFKSHLYLIPFLTAKALKLIYLKFFPYIYSSENCYFNGPFICFQEIGLSSSEFLV